MRPFFRFIGIQACIFFGHVYRITLLFFAAIVELRDLYFYRRQVVEQLYRLGVQSIPLAALISVFTGMAVSVQTAYQMTTYVPKYIVGSIVLQSVVLELAPTVIALVMAGRIGAGIASEVGTMQVSEQVDALQSMAVDPIGYLVMPRLLAGMVMLPIVIIFCDFVAILGGFGMAVLKVGLSPYEFIRGMRLFFQWHDVWIGLVKGIVYGGFISLIGSYMGLSTTQGAKGVGIAATTSVVISASLILISDYFLTMVLLKF